MTAEAELERFRELLARWLGWTFNDRDASGLGPMLADRAAAHRMPPADYLNRLAARPWSGELTRLVELISITETYFFRHGEQFRALRDEVLPERIRARAVQRVLRLLSVACSSGEEAYSLAIAAREALPRNTDVLVQVTGVDANPAVLSLAAAGRYSGWSLRETPDGVRRRWFGPVDGGYLITDEAREMVRFRRHNVTEPDDDLWQPGHYDVIFCRNLLMYLTPAAASELLARMTESLAPAGYLFLGHTDSLGTRPSGLELRHTHDAFYYRKGTTPVPAIRRPAAVAPTPAPRGPEDLYQRAMDLLRAEKFADALEVAAGLPAPGKSRERLLRGVLLVQAGRLPEATEAARRLIDDDGLNAEAHQLLGLCLEGTSSVDEAVGQYRLAAHLDPAFALPRLRLGQLARRRGDDSAAAGELDLALALLSGEDEERIVRFGGGFGRMALTMLCRSELDACGVPR